MYLLPKDTRYVVCDNFISSLSASQRAFATSPAVGQFLVFYNLHTALFTEPSFYRAVGDCTL